MPGLLGDPEFWVLVAAAVFVAIVWKRARQSIIRSLDERASRIHRELESARQLREEAEGTLAQYQAKQRDAAAEAEEIIAHARAESERVASRAARDLEQILERRQHLAEERIAQEQAKALAEIRAVAVDIAISAARQLIAVELDQTRGAAMIDAAIEALPRQLH